MNRILAFFLITVFSIFIGSQITEGWLLVPYWKSLTTSEFYIYFSKFGPTIGKFYTILTIIAALIPLSTSIYCYRLKSKALKFSLLSTLFAILFVAFFYIYFKGANQQFYDAAFNTEQLKSELITWGNWHWGRVILELLSLLFLMITLNTLTTKKIK